MPRSREGYLWTPTGSTEGLETNAVISSNKVLNPEYDVVVVGSGFAGLVAARDISRQRGVRVLLVEGRDRIGGRTWTAKALGEEFEMGGTWVHWNQPHVYSELHRYGLHRNLKTSAGTFAPMKTLYRPANSAVQEVNGLEFNEALERVAAQFFAIDGLDSRSLMPYPHDPMRDPVPWKEYDHLTVSQRLDQMPDVPQLERDMFESVSNSLGSAPSTDIGFTEMLRWYALGGHSMAGMFELAGVYKIGKGGMTSLARAILDEYEGDILFSTVISEIKQDTTGVVLKASDGRVIRGKVVVSTIPLNVLSTITFEPPLSTLRKSAIEQGHINRGAKIHFKLSRTDPSWFGTAAASPTSPNSSSDSSSPYVFAFSDHNGTQPSGPQGTYAITFGYNGQLTDKKASTHIIDSFKNCFAPDAEVQAYLTHDWMNDPLANGTWSCWGPNSMSRYLAELQKPHGLVVFASADWADGWRGFVDGAIERGRKAAVDARGLLLAGQSTTKTSKS